MSRLIYARLASTTALITLMSLGTARADDPPATLIVCQGPLPSDYCGSRGDSYVGVGYDSAFVHALSIAGAVTGNFTQGDAYSFWGAIYGVSNPSTFDPNSPSTNYATSFNGLTATRQTENYTVATALPANSVRWFDSFTNSTGNEITANIAFGGNLASDQATTVHGTGAGYVVTGEGALGAGGGLPSAA